MVKLNKISSSAILFLTLTMAFACKKRTPKNTVKLMAYTLETSEISKDNTVQIALLLDTSNSMDGLINQAKSQLWDIVNEFSTAKCENGARPNLQIALYQYGNDNLNANEGYVQQVLDFSSDLDEISEKLFSLSTNGGEEYCGKVIQTSLQQLPWNKNPDHLRLIFIAGNEPFDQGRYNYKNALGNAKEKDIVVNTIFCGNYEQGIHIFWKNGATMTGGEYMAIDHNKEVVHIATPYDEIIIQLNSKLNATYISYGSLGQQKISAQKEQDYNAFEMEEAVAIKRAVSKSSRLYNNKNWDLVDAYDDSAFNIEEVDVKDLPTELQGKSKKEIEAYVVSKKMEREKIQQQILDYNSKRSAYMAKHQAENATGELESVMIQALKKQAATKNYIWD